MHAAVLNTFHSKNKKVFYRTPKKGFGDLKKRPKKVLYKKVPSLYPKLEPLKVSDI